MNYDQTVERLIELGIPEEKAKILDLTGADLTGAKLYRANLTGANLYRANLTGADLTGADLRYAKLIGADLTDADLTGVDLKCANLSGAILTGANLTGANLSRAYLYGANLRGAKNISHSHEACAEVLRQGAKGNILIEAFAGLILLHRDWCWERFPKEALEPFASVIEEIIAIFSAYPEWGIAERIQGRRGNE
ncbi:MAG: pentapeptide repeat-containing protein [Halobacteriota archaeon]|nr:pentapeptide repeat-containing protein [Halobacteriota archaeon]